jgi:hypothetical protein
VKLLAQPLLLLKQSLVWALLAAPPLPLLLQLRSKVARPLLALRLLAPLPAMQPHPDRHRLPQPPRESLRLLLQKMVRQRLRLLRQALLLLPPLRLGLRPLPLRLPGRLLLRRWHRGFPSAPLLWRGRPRPYRQRMSRALSRLARLRKLRSLRELLQGGRWWPSGHPRWPCTAAAAGAWRSPVRSTPPALATARSARRPRAGRARRGRGARRRRGGG